MKYKCFGPKNGVVNSAEQFKISKKNTHIVYERENSLPCLIPHRVVGRFTDGNRENGGKIMITWYFLPFVFARCLP